MAGRKCGAALRSAAACLGFMVVMIEMGSSEIARIGSHASAKEFCGCVCTRPDICYQKYIWLYLLPATSGVGKPMYNAGR